MAGNPRSTVRCAGQSLLSRRAVAPHAPLARVRLRGEESPALATQPPKNHTFWSASCLAACLAAMASFVRRFLSTDSGMMGLVSLLTMAGMLQKVPAFARTKERVKRTKNRGGGQGQKSRP